jgi:hypothetical protein
MKSLTSDNQIPHLFAPPSLAQSESRLFGKKLALSQIHDFMDSYQKEAIGKLAPNTSLSYKLPVEAAPIAHCANDDREDNPETKPTSKQVRAKLHKIWLAMKPSYKPKSLL